MRKRRLSGIGSAHGRRSRVPPQRLPRTSPTQIYKQEPRNPGRFLSCLRLQTSAFLASLPGFGFNAVPADRVGGDMSPKRKTAGQKAALTRKRRAAAKKAVATRKHRAAGQEAAKTRSRRAAARKAAATRAQKQQAPQPPTEPRPPAETAAAEPQAESAPPVR